MNTGNRLDRTKANPFTFDEAQTRLRESFIPVKTDADYEHNLKFRVAFMKEVFEMYNTDGIDFSDFQEYILELNMYKMFAFEADNIIKTLKKEVA